MGKTIVNIDMSEKYNTLEELAKILKCPIKTLEGIVDKNTIRNGNTKINGQIYKYINVSDNKPVRTLKEELMEEVKVVENKKEVIVKRKPIRHLEGVYNLTENRKFDTIIEAAQAYNVSKSAIGDAAKGVQKTSVGCKWMYYDEYIKAKEAGLLEEIKPKEIITKVINLTIKKDTIINIKVV